MYKEVERSSSTRVDQVDDYHVICALTITALHHIRSLLVWYRRAQHSFFHHSFVLYRRS